MENSRNHDTLTSKVANHPGTPRFIGRIASSMVEFRELSYALMDRFETSVDAQITRIGYFLEDRSDGQHARMSDSLVGLRSTMSDDSPFAPLVEDWALKHKEAINSSSPHKQPPKHK